MKVGLLRRRRSASCGPGCAAVYPDFVGQRFGEWTVLATRKCQSAKESGGRRALVRCSCGAERTIRVKSLRDGSSTRCRSCAATRRQLKHGLAGTPIYQSWNAMNHRCHSPNDQDWETYGGRGIKVCDRWRSETYGGNPGAVLRFLEDMGERPPGMTLDRIDGDRDYEPGNCRWATALQQTRNRTRRAR